MKILFMCVANSARSQIAEGFARQLFPQFEIKSAGSRPGILNSIAIAVMKEIGLDISSHHSKSTDHLPPEFLENLDYVITLCEEEVCPILVSKAKKIHWPFKDPVAHGQYTPPEALKRFRLTRDQILLRLQEFKSELDAKKT